MQITAKASLHGHELTHMPVINPGNWFGKTWLLEIGGSYLPLFLIVEADSMCAAIDELADSEKHGHHIIVAEEDLGGYDPETCHYGPSGQVLDLDHLMIHGQEGVEQPFPCRYFGDGLPADGIEPKELEEYEFELQERVGSGYQLGRRGPDTASGRLPHQETRHHAVQCYLLSRCFRRRRRSGPRTASP